MLHLNRSMAYYDRNRDGYAGSEPRDSWRNAVSATPPGDKFVRDPHTGRYTRTPPARLPELSVPEGRDTYRSNEDLRGNYFDRVPPVRPRHAFGRPDLNSQGEEERSDYSDDAVPAHSQPYTYMAPQPGHMIYPGPVMVPAGYALPGAYAHPPPHMYMQPVMQGHPQPATSTKRVRYADEPTYYSRESPVRRERSTPRYVYEPSRAPEPSSRFSYIDAQPQQHTPVSQRSDASQPRRMYLIPNKNKPKTLECEAAETFARSADFAEDVTESLLSELLVDHVVPDLLIEVLSEKLDTMSKDHPYYLPSFDAALDVLDDAVPPLIREVVVEATRDLVSDFLDEEPQGGDGVEQVVDQMLEEALRDGLGDVVRGTVQELAESHLQKASAYDVASDLMNEYIAEVIPAMVEEIDKELDVEHVAGEEIVAPVVADLAREVAWETLEYLTGKAIQSEQREIQSAARKRLLDGACLDHLLANIALAADPPGMDEEVAAMHLTEDAMLRIMLEQYFALQSEPALTTENSAICRHHERSFTEVTLDVVAEELCATLDEDMADYDDYEQGLWNPQKERPPDWALYSS